MRGGASIRDASIAMLAAYATGSMYTWIAPPGLRAKYQREVVPHYALQREAPQGNQLLVSSETAAPRASQELRLTHLNHH